jgi:hypothetical protein
MDEYKDMSKEEFKARMLKSKEALEEGYVEKSLFHYLLIGFKRLGAMIALNTYILVSKEPSLILFWSLLPLAFILLVRDGGEKKSERETERDKKVDELNKILDNQEKEKDKKNKSNGK